jgi:hypothetical protein
MRGQRRRTLSPWIRIIGLIPAEYEAVHYMRGS